MTIWLSLHYSSLSANVRERRQLARLLLFFLFLFPPHPFIHIFCFLLSPLFLFAPPFFPFLSFFLNHVIFLLLLSFSHYFSTALFLNFTSFSVFLSLIIFLIPFFIPFLDFFLLCCHLFIFFNINHDRITNCSDSQST